MESLSPNEKPKENLQTNEFKEAMQQNLSTVECTFGQKTIKKHIITPGIKDICESIEPLKYKVRIRFKQFNAETGQRIDKSRDHKAEVNVDVGRAKNIPLDFNFLLTFFNLEEEAWVEYEGTEFVNPKETRTVQMAAWIKIIDVTPALEKFQDSLDSAKWIIQTLRNKGAYRFKRLGAPALALETYSQAVKILEGLRKFEPVEETKSWKEKETAGLLLNMAICSHKSDPKNITKAMDFLDKAEQIGSGDSDKLSYWRAQLLLRQAKEKEALKTVEERLAKEDCKNKEDLLWLKKEIQKDMEKPKEKGKSQKKKGFLEDYNKELDNEEIERRKKIEKEALQRKFELEKQFERDHRDNE